MNIPFSHLVWLLVQVARSYKIRLLIIGTFTIYSTSCIERPTKPNIILIMADDLGYGDLGCYGNTEIRTPNIDYLANHGVRLTDFHSNGPVCTASRAALLTGRYQQKSGMEGIIYVNGYSRKVGLRQTQTTIAEILKNEGYSTGIMGKWHLGFMNKFNPIAHGFDEFYGFRSGNIDYHSHYDNSGKYDWYHNLDSISETGYVTDLITKHSLDFIEDNRNDPFFLLVSHQAPHAPFQGRHDPPDRFPNKKFSYFGSTEDKKRAYKEMVEVMDEGVGDIMTTLRKLNLEENTFVFFLSDNGALPVDGNNGNLNGNKMSLLEGGHRVPAIGYWKGKIKKGVSAETMMGFDLPPTILSICNLKAPWWLEFDGSDISSALFTQEKLSQRELFWRYQNQRAARLGDWKLLITSKDTALYNLKEDQSETINLSPQNPNIQETLLNKLIDWEQTIKKISQYTP